MQLQCKHNIGQNNDVLQVMTYCSLSFRRSGAVYLGRPKLLLQCGRLLVKLNTLQDDDKQQAGGILYNTLSIVQSVSWP
jgi:hypothetical protein